MRRLLIIFSFLLLTFAVEGQAIISARPFHRAVATAERTYTDVLTDGNTKGWYEYGDGSSTYMTDDGSVISNWKDQSGNSNDVVNAAGTDLPAKDAVNSEIDFDGSDDYLRDETMGFAQPLTIYIVFKENTHVTNAMILGFNGSTYSFKQRSTSQYWGLTFGSLIQGNTGLPAAGNYQIATLTINGASSSAVLNGTTTVMSGDVGANAGVDFWVSAAAAISVKEIIYRIGVDIAGDKTLVVDYLNAKYTVY